MRGLAGLPLFVPLPGAGRLSLYPNPRAGSRAKPFRRVCEDAAFERRTLEPVGPETLSLRDLLRLYREWLGFGRARFLSVPMALMRALGRIGDLAGGRSDLRPIASRR